MSHPELFSRQVLLLVIAGVITCLSVNVALGIGISGEYETVFVQEFSSCHNDTILIQVSAMQPIYVEEYALSNCTLHDATSHTWSCFCEDSLHVSLINFFPKGQTFIFSVTSSAQETDWSTESDTSLVSLQDSDEDILSEPIVFSNTSFDEEQEKQIEKEMPSAATLIVSSSHRSNLLTGAVTGTSLFSVSQWLLIFVVVLIIALSIHIRFIDWPFFSKPTRARRLHKRAKQAFADGEHTLAEKYYAKAARLRK